MDLIKVLFRVISKYEKEFLESNGKMSDKLWFIKKDKVQESLDITISDEMDLILGVGLRAARLKYSMTVFAIEVAMRKMKSKEEALYTLEHFDTERPNAYPESMRTRFLGFLVFDNKKEGVQLFCHDVKQIDEKVSFEGELYAIPCEEVFGMLDLIIATYIQGYHFNSTNSGPAFNVSLN